MSTSEPSPICLDLAHEAREQFQHDASRVADRAVPLDLVGGAIEPDEDFRDDTDSKLQPG